MWIAILNPYDMMRGKTAGETRLLYLCRRRASPEARRGTNAARGVACRTSAGEHPAAIYGAILS